MSQSGLSVLIVDDEALARVRLRRLLGECRNPGVGHVAEASQAVVAMEMLSHQAVDVVLLDIHMPGMNGLRFARHLQALPTPPALVFVTADSAHALSAFEVSAIDYLTKPVGLERLQVALQKTQRSDEAWCGRMPESESPVVLIQDRGRLERVPVDDVVYVKAEWKYLTVRTSARSYILDGSLSELEARFPGRFVRVHRNALAAARAMRALVRGSVDAAVDDADAWKLQLWGVDDTLTVSRRQLATVRACLSGKV